MDYGRDEEGEPIYDPDNVSEEAGEEEWQQPDDAWQEAESPSAHGSDAEDRSSRPRKRLVKKGDLHESGRGSSSRGPDDERLSKEDRRRALEKSSRIAKEERERSVKPKREREKESEKEMWSTVAGEDSEDDNEGVKTHDDMAFIDDTGVEAAQQFVASDNEGSAGDAPQAEEGEDELSKIFKRGKKRKNAGPSEEEIAMTVDDYMYKMATAVEEDADLNRRSKPAINKLKLLPSVVNMLQKRQFQNEFLDRGVLSQLKNWLEPLPDGSLPNINIRTAILQLLTDLPIDLEHEDRRYQLKNSGLGKVVMFLSKLDDETTGNKKLAKDLVDKWSRPLFQKSTRYEFLRNYEVERPLPRKPSKKQVMNDSLDDDIMENEKQEPKPGQPGYRNHASRPEAIAMDFVVRPKSKVAPQDAGEKKRGMDNKRSKMNKKLQQLREPKNRKLQAERISVEGRGLTRI